ncbi:BrnT family toxin [Marispirochaeta sp.]|uniref:BrnT family toxin n=1 Tax=Marispirochaeta sp. TaxID=2038653 RepID=UPI0029C983EC|nr:BrnT family toxin [Marispirochaeta sp.]
MHHIDIWLFLWYFICMTFEWDTNKNEVNREKHNISFEQAQYAFFDANRIILQDDKHSVDENRYFCIGRISEGIVTVRFTLRDKNIRIFGAGFWREGRKRYEDKIHKRS